MLVEINFEIEATKCRNGTIDANIMMMILNVFIKVIPAAGMFLVTFQIGWGSTTAIDRNNVQVRIDVAFVGHDDKILKWVWFAQYSGRRVFKRNKAWVLLAVCLDDLW